MQESARPARVGILVEVGAVAAIVMLSVWVRWTNLQTIPVFTDEVEEVALALAILREGARPLTNVDPYMGPLWNYVLAVTFWLFGPTTVLPRLVVLIAGVLTVVLTYALGRVLFGVRVGLIGGTLLGASAVHTAVNSHVAWSNCVTPLFAVAGLLILSWAMRDGRPRLLISAGVLFGLAFHTHPTVFPVLVGSALTVMLKRHGWLRGPWPYAAALASVGVNANLIVYNALTGGRSLSYAREIQESYVRETGGESGYLVRLADLLLGLARGMSGVLARQPTMTDYLREPSLWIAVGLAIAGLILAVRRGALLTVLVVGVTVVQLPIVNPKYDPILNGRYLAPILPLCLLWIALALDRMMGVRAVLSRVRGNLGLAGSIVSGLRALVAALLIVVLLSSSLGALDRYYADVRENARTGERIFDVLRVASALGPGAQPVILDERLDRMALGPGAGIVLRVLQTTLALEGIESRVAWLGEERPPGVRDGQLVVLAARSKPRFTGEAVEGLGLRAIDGGSPRVLSQSSLYGMYRFGPTSDSRARPARRPSRSRAMGAGQSTGMMADTQGDRASAL